MGRTLRDAPADTYFHVTTRGNRKQPTYLDEHDNSWFLGHLAKVAERFDWNVLAYCLMSNHYHLAVHTPRETLSAGMQQLNGVYAQRFNWRHDVEGHLFERPFRSVIAESDEQLKEQLRYVVLNPVRAGLCEHAGQAGWTSYRATAGHVEAPGFLALDRVEALFAERRGNWRVRYAEFVASGIASSGRVLGPGPKTRLELPVARASAGTSQRAARAARGARTGA